MYGCDAPWWRHRRGLPDFAGIKVTWAGNGLNNEYADLHAVQIAKGDGQPYSQRLEWTPGVIGGGGNSGFQALNLAVQWGARRVLLVGFDMTDAYGVHWYGRNTWPRANNPSHDAFRRWIDAYNAAMPVLKARGVEVFNASPKSALKCFPFLSVQDFAEQTCDSIA